MLKKNNCSDYINIQMILHNRNKEEYYTNHMSQLFKKIEQSYVFMDLIIVLHNA